MVCFMKDIQTPKHMCWPHYCVRCLSDPLISNVQQEFNYIFFNNTSLPRAVESRCLSARMIGLFSRANDVHTSRQRGCNIANALLAHVLFSTSMCVCFLPVGLALSLSPFVYPPSALQQLEAHLPPSAGGCVYK